MIWLGRSVLRLQVVGGHRHSSCLYRALNPAQRDARSLRRAVVDNPHHSRLAVARQLRGDAHGWDDTVADEASGAWLGRELGRELGCDITSDLAKVCGKISAV